MTDAVNTGNYVALDTETTGLCPGVNEVIEIGIVRFRDWQPVKEYDILIKPYSPIPAFITNLTGISNEMVETSPGIKDVIEDFMFFIGEDDVVGHNLSFDLNFLAASGAPIKDSDLVFHDTMKIARKKLKKGVEVDNHKLCTMCDYYGIEIRNAHRAADDARATGKLFKKLVKQTN